MPSIFFTLFLGVVLGIKHAFEADHVIAVSTIVTEQKNPLRAALVGTFWGFGHTVTLFIAGIIILLLKLSISESLSFAFELFIGVMLIILGAKALNRKGFILHSHKHEHEEKTHSHVHVHQNPTHRKHHVSFLIGGIHGLAGSGALMLLVLSTVTSLAEGLYYILLFGIGSTLGMTAMSFLLSLPLLFSAGRFPSIEKYIRLISGILSILFGLYIIYQLIS